METEFFVPLNKLSIHPDNVRKTQIDTPESIAGFASNLAEVGLIHPLIVKPQDDDPKRYFIADGGRRFRAFKKLQKDGTVAKDHAIRCALPPKADVAVTDLSLSANVMAAPMHKVDQYEAFATRAEAGASEEDIARVYGMTVRAVRQCLALGRVAEPLRKLCQKGKLTLDQLQAYAVTSDTEQQVRVHKSNPNAAAWTIKRLVTEGEVPLSDRLAVFVGEDAYRQAGGAIRQTLFDDDAGGAYLTNRALLDRLAEERLQGFAADLAAEGWSFVDVLDLSQTYRPYERYPDRLNPEHVPLAPDVQAKLDALVDEADALETEVGEDGWTPELEAITHQADALRSMESIWTADQKAQAGCCLYVAHGGVLTVDCGMLHKQRKDAVADLEDGGMAPKDPISGNLAEQLSRVRTAIIGAELVNNPHIALAVTVDALAGDLFYEKPLGYAPALSVVAQSNQVFGEDLSGKTSAVAHVTNGIEEWGERLPEERASFFEWCVTASVAELHALLALAAAHAVSAKLLRGAANAQTRACDVLAEALDVDPHRWTDVQALEALETAPKALAIQAVSEVHGEVAAAKLTGKKAEIVAKATTLCKGSWLPWPLLRSQWIMETVEADEKESRNTVDMTDCHEREVSFVATDDAVGSMAPF